MLNSKYNKYSILIDDPDGTTRNYIPVGIRIIAFREQYPQGRIDTSVIDKGENFCSVEAKIYMYFRDKLPIATAHAEIKRNEYDSFDRLLEAAETKAIGRALAFAGFGSFVDNEVSEIEPVDTGIRQVKKNRPTIEEMVENTDENEVAATTEKKPTNKSESKKSTNTTNTSDDAKKENDKAEDKNQLADGSSQPTETPDSEKEKKDNAKSRKRALTKELLQEARSFICPIGEYKGKTLGEIMLSNKDCIEYYSKKLDDSDLTYYSKILIFYDQKIKEEKKKKGQGEK